MQPDVPPNRADGSVLDTAGLCAGAWRLEASSGESLANHIVFLADGGLAGWFSEGERRWRLEEGALVFLDRYDRRSTEFSPMSPQEGGPRALAEEPSTSALGGPRRLVEREPHGGLRQDAPDLVTKLRPPLRKRRNLVVVRADERSLHPGWARDISDDDRSWDLCVSFYGDPENFGHDGIAEMQVFQGDTRKYQALYDLFHANSLLWDYDYVAFPDDDLITTWRDVNEMFAICRSYRLELAQPALRGYLTHSINRPNNDYFLRYVSFVEAIAPWMSRDALRLLAPTFIGTGLSYGLDHVWPKLLGEPRDRVAIVDAVTVEHTRPVAASYDMNAALAEAWAFQMAYDAYPRQLVYGGIKRVPQDLFLRW